MEKTILSRYTLTGMDCAGCANTIESFCQKIPGVKNAEVNFSSCILKIECNSNEAKLKLEIGIQKLGFSLKEITPNSTNANCVIVNYKLKKNFKIKNKLKFIIKKEIAINSTETSNFSKKLETEGLNEYLNSENKVGLKRIFTPILVLFIIYIAFSIVKSFSPKIGYFLFTIFSLFCLFPFLKKIIQYFKVGFYFSVEFLMSVAVIGALFIHSAQEAAMVMILFQLGEALEGYTAKKASKAVEKLSSLIPEYANLVLENKEIIQIKAKNILKNQILLVKPSERFPVDGILTEGETYVDESLLTGEVIPVHKKRNEKIYAGSLNTETSVKILATQVGQEHSIARLIKLVQEAQGSKSKTLRTIEKFSKYYTPIILLIGLITAILPPILGLSTWQTSIYKGLAILLIGCPCALIISTPSAIAAGITAASKLGILIKHASALEIIGRIKTIAFDKTGTLTEGKLNVTDIISFSSNYSQDEILRFIFSLEQHSTHPLAKSILFYGKQKNIEAYTVSSVKTISGVGLYGKLNHVQNVACGEENNNSDILVSSPIYAFQNNFLRPEQGQQIEFLQAQAKTVCVLSLNKKSVGLIAIQDALKKDAKISLDSIKKLKIKSVILTGDHQRSAEAIANPLQVKILAQLTPELKLKYIQEFSQQGKIAMVGDGINDAPALAAADVGIAMGEGTDVAIDSAQIVIANKNISSVVSAIKISQKTLNIIVQNISLAILLKVLFLYLTFIGDTRLWMAILADTGATVLVTLNSLRLLFPNFNQFNT